MNSIFREHHGEGFSFDLSDMHFLIFGNSDISATISMLPSRGRVSRAQRAPDLAETASTNVEIQTVFLTNSKPGCIRKQNETHELKVELSAVILVPVSAPNSQ